jgi:hypothetical protein
MGVLKAELTVELAPLSSPASSFSSVFLVNSILETAWISNSFWRALLLCNFPLTSGSKVNSFTSDKLWLFCTLTNLIKQRTMDQAVAGDAWIEHTSFVDDSSPITCIEYDHCYDLLWYGQANGRLTSYGFSDDVQYFDGSNPEALYYAAPPEMTRMTSLPVAADGIVQLLPNHSSLVAMSCSKIRMLSLNGAGIHTWNLNHCPSLNNFSMLSSAETAFTCADLIRDPTLPRFSSSFMATSLVAGTSTNTAYLFDLTQGVDSPVMMYNVSQPTVRVQSNGHVIVAAGQDGKRVCQFLTLCLCFSLNPLTIAPHTQAISGYWTASSAPAT